MAAEDREAFEQLLGFGPLPEWPGPDAPIREQIHAAVGHLMLTNHMATGDWHDPANIQDVADMIQNVGNFYPGMKLERHRNTIIKELKRAHRTFTRPDRSPRQRPDTLAG
jgi:hypothetical protein